MGKMIEIQCPVCHSNLWIDIEKETVIRHEKTKKKNFESFDSLLVKEKEKKQKADERFIQARDLEQERRKKAEEIFKKSIKEHK